MLNDPLAIQGEAPTGFRGFVQALKRNGRGCPPVLGIPRPGEHPWVVDSGRASIALEGLTITSIGFEAADDGPPGNWRGTMPQNEAATRLVVKGYRQGVRWPGYAVYRFTQAAAGYNWGNVHKAGWGNRRHFERNMGGVLVGNAKWGESRRKVKVIAKMTPAEKTWTAHLKRIEKQWERTYDPLKFPERLWPRRERGTFDDSDRQSWSAWRKGKPARRQLGRIWRAWLSTGGKSEAKLYNMLRAAGFSVTTMGEAKQGRSRSNNDRYLSLAGYVRQLWRFAGGQSRPPKLDEYHGQLYGWGVSDRHRDWAGELREYRNLQAERNWVLDELRKAKQATAGPAEPAPIEVEAVA